MAFDFLQNLIGPVFFLVFDVDHGVDETLPPEHAETISPATASEDRAVVKRGLRVEVESRSPPSLRAIFELHPEGMEVVGAALRPERREILHIQIPGLLEVMIVGHDVGTLLGESPG